MTTTAHPPMPTFPSDVAERIMRFLKEGSSGRITLNVKDGHVRAYEITEAGRVVEPDVDRTRSQGQD